MAMELNGGSGSLRLKPTEGLMIFQKDQSNAVEVATKTAFIKKNIEGIPYLFFHVAMVPCTWNLFVS
jgi:hypothetical protein